MKSESNFVTLSEWDFHQLVSSLVSAEVLVLKADADLSILTSIITAKKILASAEKRSRLESVKKQQIDEEKKKDELKIDVNKFNRP